jgi:hypothetical protein
MVVNGMEKTHMPVEFDVHEQVQLLLPWHETGRLEPADEAFVRDHLAECPQCRAELAAERDLQSRVTSAQIDIERDWSRLAARIEAAERRSAPPPIRLADKTALSWRRPPRALWAGAAIAAQLTLIVLLGFQLLFRGEAQEYRALAAAPPEAARMMISFRPDAAEAAMREALRTAGARIVDGPTATGAYVVQTPWPDRARALEALRARPEILVAESLDPGGAP